MPIWQEKMKVNLGMVVHEKYEHESSSTRK